MDREKERKQKTFRGPRARPGQASSSPIPVRNAPAMAGVAQRPADAVRGWSLPGEWGPHTFA